MKNTSLKTLLYYLGWIAIGVGFVLTLLSWTGTCTEACEESHSYRIFGLSFESVGFLYFLLLSIGYALSPQSKPMALFTGIILAGGLGAEILFLLIQRYALHHWCPICLGIAASILVTAIMFTADYMLDLQFLLKQGKRNEISKTLLRAVVCLTAVFLGFLASFIGVTKIDDMAIEEESVQQKIAFGNKESPIEILLFTSWSCPACQKLEPSLVRIIPPLLERSKVIFVDHISDVKTLNMAPYNVSFMLHNKDKYFELRQVLHELAKTTDSPTDALVKQAAKKIDVKYQDVNYADADMTIDYFKSLSTKYDISSLPAAVIIDTKTNQHKKLSGTAQVTSENILKTIDELEHKSTGF